ncbi:MAG: Flp family type IVb pilin [Parvularculaceae bacterium]|nr:Flp family type IVb pilin [Parvularculaceae bacterium]
MIGCGQTSRATRLVADFLRDDEGATAIEYSLIVALIFLAITAAINGYTAETKNMYSKIQSNLEN